MTYSPESIHDRVAEINIIPLADVMLVLLIIFMIASPALTRKIDFELPGTAPPDAETFARVPPIRLRIDAAGQAYWNDNATPLSALQAMLAAEVELDPRHSPRLEIDASDESEYQAVARVLAAAHNANVVRVGFVRN